MNQDRRLVRTRVHQIILIGVQPVVCLAQIQATQYGRKLYQLIPLAISHSTLQVVEYLPTLGSMEEMQWPLLHFNIVNHNSIIHSHMTQNQKQVKIERFYYYFIISLASKLLFAFKNSVRYMYVILILFVIIILHIMV